MKSFRILNVSLIVCLLITMNFIYIVDSSFATGIDQSNLNTAIKTDTAIHINRYIIDQCIKNSTNYWTILVVNDKAKCYWFNIINNSSRSQEEITNRSIFMEELWAKYPIKFLNSGTNTIITFDLNDKNVTLTDTENNMLQNIFYTNTILINQKSIADQNVQPMWSNKTHERIIYYAMKELGYPEGDAQLANDTAHSPDEWTLHQWELFGIPFSVEDWTTIIHDWDHYYNPNLNTGAAPDGCVNCSHTAKSIFFTDHTESIINIGYASHFITDVGNPLHTGAEATQIIDRINFPNDYHTKYEAYEEGYYYDMNNNSPEYYSWNDAVQAISSVTKDQCIDGYPGDLTASVSQYSNQYCDDIIAIICLEPNDWPKNDSMRTLTDDVLQYTTRCTMGMVRYVAGYHSIKMHDIPGSQDGALTDYQVRFVVHNTTGTDTDRDIYLDGGSLSWPYDFRFTNSNNQKLSYWVESYDSNNATVWVKVDNIAASPSVTPINVYYGKSGDSGESNGNDTFVVFDHFDGSSLNSSLWVQWGTGTNMVSNSSLHLSANSQNSVMVHCTSSIPLTSYVIETQGKVVSPYNYNGAKYRPGILFRQGSQNGAAVGFDTYAFDRNGWTVFDWGPWSWYDLSSPAGISPGDTYGGAFRLQVTVSGSSYTCREAFRNKVINDNRGSTGSYFSLLAEKCGNDYDWVFVRKYTPHEPIQAMQMQNTLAMSDNTQINMTVDRTQNMTKDAHNRTIISGSDDSQITNSSPRSNS